jgi:hypothetical protein
MKKTTQTQLSLKEINKLNEEERVGYKLGETHTLSRQLGLEASGNDSVIHPALDAAWKETSSQGLALLFFVVIFSAIDVTNRFHNVLKRLGNGKPDNGGQGGRSQARSILRWFAKKGGMLKNHQFLDAYLQYTNYGALTWNQVRTERHGNHINKAKVLGQELMFEHVGVENAADFFAWKIQQAQQADMYYVARHLPKWPSRTRTKTVTMKYKAPKDKTRLAEALSKYNKEMLPEGYFWYRLPDHRSDFRIKRVGDNTWAALKEEGGQFIKVQNGDQVRWPREKMKATAKKDGLIRSFIRKLCKKLDWTVDQYKALRSEHMAKTPEHLFSSQSSC